MYWKLQREHTCWPMPRGSLTSVDDVTDLSRLRSHARFSHLVTYGSFYYSYAYSRSISAALWARLLAADPLSRRAGDALRSEMFAWGGDRNPNDILRSLLGDTTNVDLVVDEFVNSISSGSL